MRNLPKAGRRALERKLRDVRERSVAAFGAMRCDAEKATGRGLVQVWLYIITAALNDSTIGPYTFDALLCAYSASQGLGSGDVVECYCCGQRWSKTRAPGAVMRVSISKPCGAMIALICGQGVALPGLKDQISQGINKDFLGGDGKILSSEMMPPPGHA